MDRSTPCDNYQFNFLGSDNSITFLQKHCLNTTRELFDHTPKMNSRLRSLGFSDKTLISATKKFANVHPGRGIFSFFVGISLGLTILNDEKTARPNELCKDGQLGCS